LNFRGRQCFAKVVRRPRTARVNSEQRGDCQENRKHALRPEHGGSLNKRSVPRKNRGKANDAY
jgi:hypothetical protein